MSQKVSSVSAIDAVFNFLSSLKLAIPLIVVVATASIVGTVVVQKNVAEPGQIEELYAPATIRLFEALGFFSVYSSWWFIGLLVLLSLNLIFCTIDLVPRSMDFVNNPKKDATEHYIAGQPLKSSFTAALPAEALSGRIAQAFKKNKLSPVVTEFPDRTVYFAQRGLWWRFSVYFIHASLLVILGGGIITFRFSYNGFVPLTEGEKSNKIFMRTEAGDREPRGLDFEIECTDARFEFRKDRPDLQLDPLNVDHVKSVGLVHAWYSDLVVHDNGTAHKKTIQVNDPFNYKKFKIFQASFGITADFKNLTVAYKKKDAPDSEAKEVTLKAGETVALPETGYSLRVAEFIPDLHMSPSTGQPISRSREFFDPLYDQPAAKLEVLAADGKPVEKWVLLHLPWFDRRQDFDYVFSLKNVRPKYYTGLNVAYYPLMHVATVGAVMLAFALALRFYFTHKRYWVVVKPDESGQRLFVGGHTGRNKGTFEPQFNRFLADLKAAAGLDVAAERPAVNV